MAEQLHFSRSLYAPEAVQTAARTFAKLAMIDVAVGEHEVVVTITDPHPKLAHKLADELANHALHHTIQAARGG
jgi:hypothetical protein